jgi:hypothetical protein
MVLVSFRVARAEDEIQETKAFFERLVGDAGAAIVALDPQGTILA